jgi:hypothetical protein
MKLKTIKFSVLALLALAVSAQAQPPTWTEAQMEVWSFVQQSWADEAAENGKWPGDYVHEKYVSWGADSAGPIYRESAIKWSRFSADSSETLIYETSPAAITIEGTTAVVNYSAISVRKNAEGKRNRTVVRLSEVLVHNGEKWVFLAGSSFEPDFD